MIDDFTRTLVDDLGKKGPAFNGPEYIAKSAAEKSAQMWDAVMKDTRSGKWYNAVEMGTIMTESMSPTFETEGDEMGKGMLFGTRGKYIHTVGTIGQVGWVSTGNHPYTGIFEGADKGYVRCSVAKEPSKRSDVFAPGIGVKFLRDGVDSANFVAMYSVDGQHGWDFFKNDFTNHIPAGSKALWLLEKKFATVTHFIQEVGLSDMAGYKQDGTKIDTPVFPFSLRFHPTGELSTPDAYAGHPFTEDLMKVPVSSTLWEVWAYDKPAALGGVETHIADLKLTSDMTSSKWGDEHFFIRHQFMDDDVALHPEWEPYLDKFGLFGTYKSAGCPFAQMFLQ